MKGFKWFLVLALLSTFVSCSDDSLDKFKELAVTSFTNAGTAATATALQCANTEAVKASVYAAVTKVIKVDSAAQKKGVGNILCQTTFDAAIPVLLGAAVPAEWECTLTDVNAAAEIIKTEACSHL